MSALRILQRNGQMYLALALAAIATSFVLLAIIGTIHGYSPVPFWDSWDGYIGFYLRILHGDTTAWWSFHNDHRLILSRLFFYADMAWAGGKGVIPQVGMLFSAAAAAGILCSAISELTPGESRALRISSCSTIIALSFYWSQRENFTWAFQIQFLLAVLLPLGAFWQVARDIQGGLSSRPFLIACLLGLACLGTMANGVLVLPLMLVYAISVGMQGPRVFVLAALAVAGFIASTLGHVADPSSPSLLSVFVGQPIAVAKFILLYLGSPLWFAIPQTTRVLPVIGLTGGALIVLAAAALFRAWPARHAEPLRLALLAFVAFGFATAFATALGRLDLGLSGALSGRYTTVSLMTWCALFAATRGANRANRNVANVAALVGLLVLGRGQWMAIQSQDDMRFRRELAGLALTLQASDDDVIEVVFPFKTRALTTALAARDERLSIFADSPLSEAPHSIGHRLDPKLIPTCTGRVTAGVYLPDSPRLQRIQGWIKSPVTTSIDRLVIVDSHDTITGFALSRPGVPAEAASPRPGTLPFLGYASSLVALATNYSTLRACTLSKATQQHDPE